ncbi:hypothetical protein ACLB1G_19715 [Oxalobacteraceae bacterium A2-2]
MSVAIYFFTAVLGFVQLSDAAAADSLAERNGLIVSPPDMDIKNKIFVANDERDLASTINFAVPSVVNFVKTIRRVSIKSKDSDVDKLFPNSMETPHLPPVRNDAPGRYVVHYIYCWKHPDVDHLSFMVEWADVTSNLRYVTSYVMKINNKIWVYEKNGDKTPWFWREYPPAKIRSCPS